MWARSLRIRRFLFPLSGLKFQKLLKTACIVFGFVGLILGSISGYMQTVEPTGTVVVKAVDEKIEEKMNNFDTSAEVEKY